MNSKDRNPNDRLLQVMEYMMSAPPGPVKQVDMARDLEISTATLNRIIKTLSSYGYIFRTKEKYCVRNFRLTRNVPMSDSYLSFLDRLMNDITANHRVSMEAVVVSGFDLLWHLRTQLPDANVAIRASTGFRRNLHELDALSRLYLSRIEWDEIEYKFNPGGFFSTGLDRRSFSSKEAQATIQSAKGDVFTCDFDGNHIGVRRFATIIQDDQGNFMHLLSIAEAAVPVSNKIEHIEMYRTLLNEAREKLEAEIRTEGLDEEITNEHELHPPHVG